MIYHPAANAGEDPSVDLVSPGAGRICRCKLPPLERMLCRRLIDERWWKKYPHALRLPSPEPDCHWCWEKLTLDLSLAATFGRAIMTPDGSIEAACMYQLGIQSFLVPGALAVGLLRLATAPWNRPWLETPPRFRGCGEAFLIHVVLESLEFGLEGRVILTALPDPKTERFYYNRGFIDTGEREDGALVLELPARSALELLRTRGLSDGSNAEGT